MTAKTKTLTDDIYVTFRKILKRSQDIEAAYRSGGDLLVFHELREGKPVMVNHSFKWNGEMTQRGQEFHPGMMFIARMSELMQQPSTARILVSKQEWEDRLEWQKLQPIIEQLRPMVDKARDYKSQALQAEGATKKAEEAARYYHTEWEAAESNLKQTEQAAAEYIAGLSIEI